MIAYIKGTIAAHSESSLILVVNNIGYEVFVLPRIVVGTHVGQELELYTYHHVREDAVLLYGFTEMVEKRMFEKLITISGVGPKSAMGVLTAATVAELEQAVAQGDSSSLTKVAGVGKKTAERIVLELKGKLDGLGSVAVGVGSSRDGDVIEALMGLGYTREESREALKHVGDEAASPDETLKAALRILSRA